jgi:hypothetical protein
VPPPSARALAGQLPRAVTADMPLGHIGMIAGGQATRTVYPKLLEWLGQATARSDRTAAHA